MGMSFRGRKHELLSEKLLALLEQCQIKKKLGKKVGVHKVPVKIKDYKCLMIFEQPASVVDIDYEKQQVDVKMKTAFVSLDGVFPENQGTAVVRYKLSYEAFSKILQFRGATIVSMSFGKSMLGAIKSGMKKKAGNLNLNLSVADCF